MSLDYTVILWCVYAGIVLAALYAYYQKNLIGRLVRALLENTCDSPKSAKTLGELGLEKDVFVRNALHPKSTLTRLVSSTEEPVESQRIRGRKQKPAFSFESARFYISPDKKDEAMLAYDHQGTTLLSLVFAIVGGLLIIAVGYYLVPYLSSLFTQIFS